MLFCHLSKIFFLLFAFPYIIMYTPDISRAIKKMSADVIRDFIFENYYKRIGFSKENSYYSMKLLKERIYCLL